MGFIETDTLLAMCLFDKEEISLKELNDIKTRLEGKFKNDLVDTSSPGIQNAFYYYGSKSATKLFRINKYPGYSKIARGKDWNKRFIRSELFSLPIYQNKIKIGAMISEIKEYRKEEN